MYDRLTALIVEPHAAKRGYLWQATLNEPQFCRVKGLKTLEECLIFLANNSYDVLLLSSSFSRDKIASFVAAARELSGGREAAYISVVPEEDQTKENIARELIGGIDGFLFIPFSVSSLKEVAKIAYKVKKKFEDEKKRAALKLLLPELSKSVDNYSVATMITSDQLTEVKEHLLEVLGPVRTIAQDLKDDYVNALAEYFEKAPPRTLPAYKGASERVKAMYEKSIKSKIS